MGSDRSQFFVQTPVPRPIGLVLSLLGLAVLAGIHLSWPDVVTFHLLVPALGLGLALFGLSCVWRDHRRGERERTVSRQWEEARAQEMAHDGATGALIRRVFLDSCKTRIAASLPGRPLAYFAVDMDHLKILNDSLGHEVGDAALRRLVEAIRQVAGSTAIVGRVGGDEFAVLTDCASAEEAREIAARFHGECARPTKVHGRELTLSATVGTVLLPEHTSLLKEAIHFSDLALYEGKNAGRNRAIPFTRAMLRDFHQQQQIERELRLDLERGELQQLYQPIVDAHGTIVAAQSVVEWNSRWLGAIPYATFIGVAETTALIDRVGEWSFRRACTDACLIDHGLTVSIPVSAAQLKRDGVVEMVRNALAESGLSPSRVCALISRATTLSANSDVERRLNELRALGIRISLDDLGAIVCDFERLRHFPVDVVRIRPDQIAHLGESETDNAVISALVNVGNAMGLQVVADGIASSRQLILARAAGCHLFSGPYFAEPRSVALINEQIAAQKPQALKTPTLVDA